MSDEYHHFTATELRESAMRGHRLAENMLLNCDGIDKLDMVHAVGAMAVAVFRQIEPEPQKNNPLDPRLIEFDNWCAIARKTLADCIALEKKQ